MGQGLQRVAKQCGGLVVQAHGRRVKFSADGKIISDRLVASSALPQDRSRASLASGGAEPLSGK